MAKPPLNTSIGFLQSHDALGLRSEPNSHHRGCHAATAAFARRACVRLRSPGARAAPPRARRRSRSPPHSCAVDLLGPVVGTYRAGGET